MHEKFSYSYLGFVCITFQAKTDMKREVWSGKGSADIKTKQNKINLKVTVRMC